LEVWGFGWRRGWVAVLGGAGLRGGCEAIVTGDWHSASQ
jgi:hypothetical protein